MHTPIDGAVHEPGPLEHTNMLRHRGERHVERRGQVGDLRRSPAKTGEKSTPRTIRERRKNQVTQHSLPSHQGSEVSNVVSSGPGHEQVAKPFEKVVRVGTLLKVSGAHSKISRALDGFAVSHGAGGGRISVNSIGARADNGDVLSRDSFRAGENKRLVAASHAVAGHGAA